MIEITASTICITGTTVEEFAEHMKYLCKHCLWDDAIAHFHANDQGKFYIDLGAVETLHAYVSQHQGELEGAERMVTSLSDHTRAKRGRGNEKNED